MSKLVVPDSAEQVFLGQIKAALDTMIAATKLKVTLYKNNYTPIGSSVIADFDVADFAGTAVKNFPTTTAVFENDQGVAEFDATALLVWTATDGVTPNTIYGYFVHDTTTGDVLLWAERFDTPVLMDTAGKTLLLLPRLQLGNLS